jgi:hypothetical protein
MIANVASNILVIAAIKVMQKSRLTPEDLLALSVEISAMTRLSKNDAFVELYGKILKVWLHER